MNTDILGVSAIHRPSYDRNIQVFEKYQQCEKDIMLIISNVRCHFNRHVYFVVFISLRLFSLQL